MPRRKSLPPSRSVPLGAWLMAAKIAFFVFIMFQVRGLLRMIADGSGVHLWWLGNT
jgi:hypothetical protein